MPVDMIQASIPPGEFRSNVLDATDRTKIIPYVFFPFGWHPKAPCLIELSFDGKAFRFLIHDDGSYFSLNVVEGGVLLLPPDLFRLSYFRLHSGEPEAPVPQNDKANFKFAIG